VDFVIEVPTSLGAPTTKLNLDGPEPAYVRSSILRRGLLGYGGLTAAALYALASRKPQGTFFDIGANIGIYAALLGTSFPDLNIHAFEPFPASCDNLKAIAAANGLNINLHRCALSDSIGTASLTISAQSDASHSLSTRRYSGTGVIEVPTTTLDEAVRTLGVVPDLIKVDVERHEPAVVRGSIETLTEHRPIVVIELLSSRSEKNKVLTQRKGATFNPDARETRSAFVQMGYTPQRIRRPAHLDDTVGKSASHDFIMWPDEVDPDFDGVYAKWVDALVELRDEMRTIRRQNILEGT